VSKRNAPCLRMPRANLSDKSIDSRVRLGSSNRNITYEPVSRRARGKREREREREKAPLDTLFRCSHNGIYTLHDVLCASRHVCHRVSFFSRVNCSAIISDFFTRTIETKALAVRANDTSAATNEEIAGIRASVFLPFLPQH